MKKVNNNDEYLESYANADQVINFGCSIPGASETHYHDDGGSKTFILQKDGTWKKTEETRKLTFEEIDIPLKSKRKELSIGSNGYYFIDRIHVSQEEYEKEELKQLNEDRFNELKEIAEETRDYLKKLVK